MLNGAGFMGAGMRVYRPHSRRTNKMSLADASMGSMAGMAEHLEQLLF